MTASKIKLIVNVIPFVAYAASLLAIFYIGGFRIGLLFACGSLVALFLVLFSVLYDVRTSLPHIK